MVFNEQLQWINTLTDKQLTEFLTLVFQARNHSSEYEDSRFFLGSADRYREGDVNEPWNVHVVGVHDPAEYKEGWSDDVPLCQFGRCSQCEVETVSYAKQSLCALCGKNVYGT